MNGHDRNGPAASELKLAGLTPFTTIDFPGRLSAVAFVQGCPWRCVYCQNSWMQQRSFDPGLEHSSWEELESLLKRRHGLLDGVVFSGGEPCLDPALPAAVRAVKEMGYEVGLHTGGSYPARLAEVLPDLSWVGLDVKAVPADGAHWAMVTGVESAQDKWTESLGLLLASGVPFECRTTAHPDYFSEAQLLETAAFLQARDVKDYALQICRKPLGLIARFGAVDPAWPSEPVLEKLRSGFERFTLRRDGAKAGKGMKKGPRRRVRRGPSSTQAEGLESPAVILRP